MKHMSNRSKPWVHNVANKKTTLTGKLRKMPGNHFGNWQGGRSQKFIVLGFPGGPVFKTLLSLQGTQVWFLVGEVLHALRCSQIKKEEKEKGKKTLRNFYPIFLVQTKPQGSQITKKRKFLLRRYATNKWRNNSTRILFATPKEVVNLCNNHPELLTSEKRGNQR